MALMVTSDLLSFNEAIKSLKWRLAMGAEIEAIKKKTCELTKLPLGAKKI